MDLEIRRFKQGIIQFINDSTLPLEVKRLVLAEVVNMVTSASDEVIKQQVQQIVESTKENPEDDDCTECQT